MDNSALLQSVKKLLAEEVAIGFVFFIGFCLCWFFCLSNYKNAKLEDFSTISKDLLYMFGIGWIAEHAILFYKFELDHQLPLLHAALVSVAVYNCYCESYTSFQHKFCISAVLLYLSSAIFNGFALGIELLLRPMINLAPMTVVFIDAFVAFLVWLFIVGTFLSEEDKKAVAKKTKSIV